VRSFLVESHVAHAFHVFEPPSREAMERVIEVARLDHERITEVIE
jgi:hypothetical protein